MTILKWGLLIAAIFVMIYLVLRLIGLCLRRRAGNKDGSFRRSIAFSVLIALILLLGALIASTRINDASADTQQPPKPPPGAGPADASKADFKCNLGDPGQLAEPPQYGTDNPDALEVPTDAGMAKGDGPPMDHTSLQAAVNDDWIRTGSSPLYMAKRAVALHFPGYVPDGTRQDSNELPAVFVNQKAADLFNHRDQWAEARKQYCAYLQYQDPNFGTHLGDLQDDPVFQMGTLEKETDVNGTKLPVSDVNIQRINQPAMQVLWIMPSKDLFSADVAAVHTVHPVAIDLGTAWVSILGPMPSDVVKCVPPTQEQKQLNEQKQDRQDHSNQNKAAQAAQPGGNGNGGNCGGTCVPAGPGNTGCGSCPGSGGSTVPGCNTCPSPPPPSSGLPPPSSGPTSPPTTKPAPPTTKPVTTVTTRPTTVTTPPPTTPPTTKSNPATTITVIPCPPKYLC